MSPNPFHPGTAREQIAAVEHRDHGVDPPFRQKLSSIDIQLAPAAKIAGHIKVILGTLTGAVLVLAAFCLWLSQRPSEAYVNSAETRAINVANEKNAKIEALTVGLAELKTDLAAMRREDDRRWDKLDQILEKHFGDTTSTTPPQTFGPSARRQGKPQ